MLLDVTGTLIAFISIILILSILVTAAVQLIQSVLRLRARNLLKGLAQIIMATRKNEPAVGIGWLKGTPKNAKREAAKLLNSPNIALINRVKKPEGPLHYFFLGPKVSWVEPKELVEAAKALHMPTNLEPESGPDDQTDEEKKDKTSDAAKANGDTPSEDPAKDKPEWEKVAEALGVNFEKANEKLRDRFQLIIRVITFVVGFAVAFGFQVSTPELFSKLSNQTTLQMEISGNAKDLLEEMEDRVKPDEPGGEGSDKTVEELQKDVQDLVKVLGQYELVFWEDPKYYYTNPRKDNNEEGKGDGKEEEGVHQQDNRQLNANRLLGVFLTAVLLSLGAPFWYERLRDALRFRDLLSGKAGMGPNNKEKSDEKKAKPEESVAPT